MMCIMMIRLKMGCKIIINKTMETKILKIGEITLNLFYSGYAMKQSMTNESVIFRGSVKLLENDKGFLDKYEISKDVIEATEGYSHVIIQK